jgi:hypothetical protein
MKAHGMEKQALKVTFEKYSEERRRGHGGLQG